jgi:hypothetical protein
MTFRDGGINFGVYFVMGWDLIIFTTFRPFLSRAVREGEDGARGYQAGAGGCRRGREGARGCRTVQDGAGACRRVREGAGG